MRWLAMLSLLAACASMRDDGDEQIATALGSARDSDATLIDGDRVYYLGPTALRAERAAFNDVLRQAPSRTRDYVRGWQPPAERGDDGVVGLRYAQQSFAFAAENGYVRVQRARTGTGRYYWVSLRQGRWTFTNGPVGGAEVDRAWDRLVRGAAREAGALQVAGLVPRDPAVYGYDAHLRDVGVDFRGLNQDG